MDITTEQLSAGMQYQLQIYFAGTQNVKPQLPVSFEELEQKASEVMKPEAFAYIAGSAGSEITTYNNKEAFNHWQIIPRMMGDVSQRSIVIELFGMQLPTPVLLAPVGVLSIAHPEAEVAVARAAKNLRVPQIVSTVSSKTIEEIGSVHGDHPHWFQLYWGRNNDFTRSIINRAEKAGYTAIVVTLDTRLFAWRERDIKNAYLPFLYNEGLANYFTDPVFLAEVGDPARNKMETMMHFANCFSNPSSTWNDLAVIRECTKLPVIVKGIQHANDAKKSIDHGADGIIVSNHGGRQLDGAIGAIDTLAGICDEVSDKTTILFDSGIRRGADVFKAMALGAKAVLVGRPYAYGLALAGEQGVKEVIANLLADVDLTMGLAGCNSWKDVTRDKLHHRN
ncbi:alpha-hydroxy-acid oxidizing protein [Ginsengibacter hankyongi]|uniref:Alpha-hydroxy-acid oxidizing protein n=1 Tax=Ginsengibacter hankyongi TaxID=2607284 RepID=A0A5J5IHI2_9BACT|nr:alpha-hydroxy-acid oxidizing protein [Ginsengibacter hankyongi]KAA9039574.1 alpha-hydroxy-acid oxidizing protein [Ginsengibacter hankyongi]